MPIVEFEATRVGRAKTTDAPDGGPLVDLCDEILAPVPFSCRSATCGTCHIIVTEGIQYLEVPSDEEQELLAVLRSPLNTRLACQAILKPGPGLVRIRPVDV